MKSNTVGTRIKQIRLSQGLNQNELANLINVTQPTISYIEAGKSEPQKLVLDFICEKFKVNYNWLTTGIGEPYKDATGQLLSTPTLDRVEEIFSNEDSILARALISTIVHLTPEQLQSLYTITQLFSDQLSKAKHHDDSINERE